MRESLLTYTAKLLSENLPFLLLRKSGGAEVKIIHQESKKLYKKAHDTMSSAFFSKFLSSDNQFYIYGEVIKRFDWNFKPFKSEIATVKLSKDVRLAHEMLVSDAVSTIQNTNLEKVVLSLKHPIQAKKTPLEILGNLLDKYSQANCYFFYHPAVGSWMGATPETLLSYNSGLLKTMSLAGTKSAENDHEKPWGMKEQNEQLLVTEYIAKALQKVADSPPTIGPVKTVQAGSLLHLKTTLEVPLSYDKINQAIKELHPTPAICGLPRTAAQDYIITHENYDRSFYTGYLGIQNPQDQTADYFVNLRCMELKNNYVDLYAGGGITGMSVPQDEVDEIENKLSTMASIV